MHSRNEVVNGPRISTYDDRGGVTTNQNNTSSSSTMTHNNSLGGRKLILPEELERDPHILTITEWGPMRLKKWQYWQEQPDEISTEYFELINHRADPNPNFN